MMFREEREKVVETCLLLADGGYLAGTGGNLALRTDETHFLVTPSATDYYAMGAADVCVLRLADRARIEGERAPSVEAGMHAAVLGARPDCRAVVHTHQPIGSAYSLLGIALDIDDGAPGDELGRRVPCVAYAPSGTGWLARRVGRVFDAGTHACLMRNHGVVAVGVDIGQAVRRVAALEAACARYFLARGASGVLVSDTLAAAAGPGLPGSAP